MELVMRDETIEEYLARGGKITRSLDPEPTPVPCVEGEHDFSIRPMQRGRYRCSKCGGFFYKALVFPETAYTGAGMQPYICAVPECQNVAVQMPGNRKARCREHKK